MQRNVELRKLPSASLYNLATILEINNDWRKIVPLIPKNLQSEQFERKYNYEHMRLIEDHARKTSRTCAEVLFDEWATSGRVRPTLDTLMKTLCQAQLFRAVDEIARMLGESSPGRPKVGPAALIPTDITELLNDESMEQRLNSMASIEKIRDRGRSCTFTTKCRKTSRLYVILATSNRWFIINRIMYILLK